MGRVEPADVVRPELGEGEEVQRRLEAGEPGAIGVARGGAIEPYVVADDDDAVAGDADIKLQRRDPDRERLGESRQCVLRHQSAGATVALEFESLGFGYVDAAPDGGAGKEEGSEDEGRPECQGSPTARRPAVSGVSAADVWRR